ncbi:MULTISPECIES: cytochrome c biogenesis heme-transporting ATPase CcmA [Vibrio]|uniref:cytochrome c biogenesis heme-transporting ATPase CcmA n=1 Tax=Vibrio TaxID=662 RepID=UPI000C1688E6|nr:MULTISPECIES: cytochrome c biogenesis heme-transporting ATPase CcmA [Vibrio]NNN43315.1 cytochrome c biogenesis heme-transporting ATPase CcmA [Vibrio sp. 1-1(7)]NNN71139.1 cytochrome c biogenesis heme-transporting ATPase CcmA [Vibrio sp. 12-2(3-a)]
MLEAKNLTAIRDDRVLFEELSFNIQAGELVQVEGRNGTGKTTLLRMITGLGNLDAGQILWKGENIAQDRESFHRDLLFLGHQTGIKRELTPLENLRFYQKVSNSTCEDQPLYQALAKVGLVGVEEVPVAQLSAGQQRRVALARLWLSEHLLWVLDEPLTAIDKQGVWVLEQLFLRHTEVGGMIMLTTHQDMFTDNAKLRKIKLGVESCSR